MTNDLPKTTGSFLSSIKINLLKNSVRKLKKYQTTNTMIVWVLQANPRLELVQESVLFLGDVSMVSSLRDSRLYSIEDMNQENSRSINIETHLCIQCRWRRLNSRQNIVSWLWFHETFPFYHACHQDFQGWTTTGHSQDITHCLPYPNMSSLYNVCWRINSRDWFVSQCFCDLQG